jgi:SOS-response transcriptional repressor LexA
VIVVVNNFLPKDWNLESIGRRLRQLREALAATESRYRKILPFSKSVGISNSTWDSWEKSESVPNATKLAQIVEKTGANAQWLVTGHGEMFLPSSAPGASGRVSKPTTVYSGDPVQAAAAQIEAALGTIRNAHARARDTLCVRDVRVRADGPGDERLVGVPILADEIAAGPPREVRDGDIADWAVCYAPDVPHPSHTWALRVRGESMEPLIADGGLVGVDVSVTGIDAVLAARPPLAAVRHEGGCLVRVCRRIMPDLAVFEPFNASGKFPSIACRAGEESPIVGKVVWIYRPVT